MNYKKKLKEIDKKEKIVKLIKLKDIHAQYNPNRFKQWKSLYNNNEKSYNILNMKYSPHYEFLEYWMDDDGIKKFKKYENLTKTKYYKMQKKYGRNSEWIDNKINSFIRLRYSIEDDGFFPEQKIIVLNKPLIQNKYNSGLEIFEGNHRLACLLHLGYEEIECKFVNN